jgi:hypothetical protein
MSPTISEIREQVASVMRRRGVVHAAVFGSVARGEARPDSDVDFLGSRKVELCLTCRV